MHCFISVGNSFIQFKSIRSNRIAFNEIILAVVLQVPKRVLLQSMTLLSFETTDNVGNFFISSRKKKTRGISIRQILLVISSGPDTSSFRHILYMSPLVFYQIGSTSKQLVTYYFLLVCFKYVIVSL